MDYCFLFHAVEPLRGTKMVDPRLCTLALMEVFAAIEFGPLLFSG